MKKQGPLTSPGYEPSQSPDKPTSAWLGTKKFKATRDNGIDRRLTLANLCFQEKSSLMIAVLEEKTEANLTMKSLSYPRYSAVS